MPKFSISCVSLVENVSRETEEIRLSTSRLVGAGDRPPTLLTLTPMTRCLTKISSPFNQSRTQVFCPLPLSCPPWSPSHQCAREIMHYSLVNNKKDQVCHHVNTQPLDRQTLQVFCESQSRFIFIFLKKLPRWKPYLKFAFFDSC